MPKVRRLALIVNTKSKTGREEFDRAKAWLKRQTDVDLVWSQAVTDPSRLLESVRRALNYRPHAIVLGSGDGTISEVVDELARGPVALALLPLGTTNNFARTLGLPLDGDEALEVAARGPISKVDLAEMNGDLFANVATIGLSVEVARRVSPKLKKRIGRAAYAWAAFKGMLGHQALRVEIENERGERRIVRTHQLVIANGSYHSAVKIHDEATITDGKLLAFTMSHISRRQLVANFVRFSLGGLERLEDAEVVEGARISIKTTPAAEIELDGEIKGTTPAMFKVAPRALAVVLPPVRESGSEPLTLGRAKFPGSWR